METHLHLGLPRDLALKIINDIFNNIILVNCIIWSYFETKLHIIYKNKPSCEKFKRRFINK